MILTADLSGERLDGFLSRSLPDLSRSAAQKLLEQGLVLRNGKPGKKNDRLEVGDEISVTLPEPKALDVPATQMELDIVYEDEDVLVINKPKGLVVHPAAGHQEDTLVNGLLYAFCMPWVIAFPASTAFYAPALSTESTKIPPAFWPLPKMTLPIQCWHPS